MADEELRISVKLDQEKAAENTRLLKDSFRSITDVQHVQRFEALGRQFQLTDQQLKQLGTAILKPNDALSGFAMGFGRAGTILLAFDAAVAVAKYVTTTFSDAASRQLDISNAAKRMGGIHAAQLDANVHAMERERIERGRGFAMMENFSRRRAEFLEHSSQFKRSIMENVEGPFADVVQRHFAELHQATDTTTMMNLVRRFSDQIEKYYRERGRPGDAERGAQMKREYLEKWFGLPDIAQLTTDFVKVSKETEDAWDRNQKAAEEFWRVTTDISDNFSKIISSVLTQTMDDLGIGTLLRTVNAFLERGVKEHDEIGAMSPEERAKYLESLIKEGDAAWRKAIIDFLFSSSPKSHDFPRPGGRPGAPVHLLEDLNDKQTDLITEEKRLVENLQFLNAILSGESGIGGQKPTFHNAPMGGAEGESNPIQIPDDVQQPGGGAAAEARDTTSVIGRPGILGRPETYPKLPSTATPLTRSPGTPRPAQTEGRGFASWYGNRPDLGFRDKEGQGREGVREQDQGIALGDPKTLGGWFYLTDPHTGIKHLVQQTDTGPTAKTFPSGKGLWDVERAPAGVEKPGFRRGGSDPIAEENARIAQDVSAPNIAQGGLGKPEDDPFGPTLQWLYNIPARGSLEHHAPSTNIEDYTKQDIPTTPDRFTPAQWQQKFREFYKRGDEIKPSFGVHWGRDIDESLRRFNEQSIPMGTGASADAGLTDEEKQDLLSKMGASRLDAGRRRLDRDMGDALDVSGRLNVAVDAPAGTDVKATGGGMFANSVSVDRRVGFEE